MNRILNYILVLTMAAMLPVYADAAPAKKKAPAKKTAVNKKKSPAKKGSGNKKKSTSSSNTDLHYISMWGGAGYSGMVQNYTTVSDWNYGGLSTQTFDPKFLGSGGGLLGFGYELHHKRFQFAVGPEFRLLGSSDKLQFGSDFNVSQADYAGEGMVQHYSFDKLKEKQTVGQVTLPVYFGGSFDKVYFMAGFKVGYSLFGSWKHVGKLTTAVTDEWAVEDWYDIPSHNLVTSTKIGEHPSYVGDMKGKNKWGLDAVLSAEVGVNLNEFFSEEWNEKNEKQKHPWLMRVGAFIDYGMPILSATSADNPAAALAYVNQTTIAMNSLHQSQFADKKVSSLLVGIKFTALLQLNKPKVPNPRMSVLVSDFYTGKPITDRLTNISIMAQGKKRPQIKKTNPKTGMLIQRYPKGQYDIVDVQALGYASNVEGKPGFDTIHYQHENDMVDTIQIKLYSPRISARAYDRTSGEQLEGKITLTSRRTGEKKQYSLSALDSLLIDTLAYGDSYRIHVEAAEHHPVDTVISDLYRFGYQFHLRPYIRVKRTFDLKRMYFAVDKTDILPTSEADLQYLEKVLKENPRIRILITGHTDSDGSEEHNQKLSEGRSASVKAEMVRRGVDESRMETDGKGESEPIDTNLTAEGKQNNRRVQITIFNPEDAEEDIF